MEKSDESLLRMAKLGDSISLEVLFHRYSLKLFKIASRQLDPRLNSRIDVADVVQEVMLEFSKRINEFSIDQGIGLYQWLCFLTKQKIAELERFHIHAQMRDVRKEVPLVGRHTSDSSLSLATHLISQISSPSSAVGKAELAKIIHQAIASLDTIGREAIVLKHINQMSTEDAARLLEINQSTFRQRYFRALKQLRKILNDYDLCWGES